MIRLPDSLRAWRTPDFKAVLKQEIEQLGAVRLPLQRGLTTSSHVLDEPLEAMIIGVTDEPGFIGVKVGIFFSGVIAGCNCADDPTPVEAQNEYCELRLAIDKVTGATSVTLEAD